MSLQLIQYIDIFDRFEDIRKVDTWGVQEI